MPVLALAAGPAMLPRRTATKVPTKTVAVLAALRKKAAGPVVAAHREKVGSYPDERDGRNRLHDLLFIECMHDDFIEHGVATIEKVRQTRPAQYLQIIASILPK